MKIIHFLCIVLTALLFSTQALATHHEAARSSGGNMPHNEGIVVSIIDTTGYTYMELDNGKHRFWIAAPTTQVKAGDHIRFTESMTMTNFTSKSLNRTFGTLVFVNGTQIKK